MGVVCVLVMMEGFEVSMRSRMLPDSMRVGSFTIFCSPNSLIISSSLLCLLAVLVGTWTFFSNWFDIVANVAAGCVLRRHRQ